MPSGVEGSGAGLGYWGGQFGAIVNHWKTANTNDAVSSSQFSRRSLGPSKLLIKNQPAIKPPKG